MMDVLIRGGTVIDGTGEKARRADVAVKDGMIAAVGELNGERAETVLDAEGAAVTPGFIDMHSHSDTAFLLDDSCASKLCQGITTEITGNCGDSPFPCSFEETEAPWKGSAPSFSAFLQRFQDGHAMATNQAMLVGHGALRSAVVGLADRPAADGEIEKMQELLRRDLAAGAWGLSLGLEYAPGFFADQRELRALAKVVQAYDGLLPAHMRSEGLKIDEALQELLSLGRETGARVHASHLKLDNFRVHGRAAQVWDAIRQARREGMRVSADLYPYTASCTTLSIRCPDWSLDGGDEALVKRLQGDRRQEIVAGIRAHYFNAHRADTCLFSDDGGFWPQIVGRTLRQVAQEELHTDDYAQAAADILIRTRGKAWCIFFVMSEDDMLYFLRQETAIGTDARALPGDPAKISQSPHPRAYGALPEFFRLNRVHGFCSLEEAVKRVTGLPAGIVGLRDRGLLLPGLAADITVFDPASIAPQATYAQPVQLARGVRHVLVNGQIALRDGKQTALRAGQFLRKR